MVANGETEPAGATDDTEPGPSALKRLYLATLGSGVVIRGRVASSSSTWSSAVRPSTSRCVSTSPTPARRSTAPWAEWCAATRIRKRRRSAELSAAADRLQERMDRL